MPLCPLLGIVDFSLGVVKWFVYGKYECHHADVCVLCASCGSPQCCVLHDLQFVNAYRCKGLPYGRVILQSRSHDCLMGSHEYLLFVVGCLLVHVHFNLSLSLRDSRVPEQRPSVCSISLTILW